MKLDNGQAEDKSENFKQLTGSIAMELFKF